MQIGRIHSWKKVTAQLFLLALPTIALAVYLLWDLNRYYSVLQNRYAEQGLFFATGIVTSLVFYGYRFRFITTAALLGAFYYLVYKIIGNISVGEFDAFFVSVRFLMFAILFSLGWVAGYGFSRSRYFTIFWAVFLLALQIIVVSRTAEVTANAIIFAFAPVLAYAFYVIYIAELIRNMNEDEKGFVWFIGKRLIGFTMLAGVVLVALLLVFQKDFQSIEHDWGGAQGGKEKGGKESMTKENRDGSISNKDQMKMTSSLSKDKRLVFVARVDNYFPDGKTPNPLYFTSRYYTRFDTSTQTFETDDKMPYNDLFSPDPSKIPLYFAKTDSTVLTNTKATKGRKVVTADVYKTLLSPHDYLAPSTAFYCQPIAVENEYKDQFKSAYRAKMWVSDLNSAYFIYNPAGNDMLELFQQTRFNELRTAGPYSSLDKTFRDYYTFMPANEDYKRIVDLAKDITKDAHTPVDKVVAIRDFFLGKDEFGQPLFRYSDNPGIPGLPSASKLNYFLFENRKGYCAYYAGATLFLLRALGIPSRIAAGFLTVDRSSKNPGWYWFYADQAHAWVQVYFPGYGWIDFDTTVPDQNTQQAAQPDGTPPMNTQQALLVADGEAISVDTAAKRVTMKVKKLMYHDQNFTTDAPKDMLMDVSVASITRDTGLAVLSDIKKGTNIVAVSFAEVFKNKKPVPTDNLSSLVDKSPKPAPIDEVKIMETEEQKKERQSKQEEAKKPFDWVKAAWITLSVLGGFIIILFSLPWLIWLVIHNKAKGAGNARSKAYNVFTASTYYLNQLGYTRHHQSPAAFATQVDQTFKTSFSSFNNIYQKVKYSTTPLTANEEKAVHAFYPSFVEAVKKQVPVKTRFSRFLNVYNTLHFFTKPK
ncbi:transglutaminase-like domain-containing protein [Aridibaculum aurantiacum]|uniref:transglutaminase-like domain-containing protein n=1 Tax=Aridibaculum aurantiacum TaxID=2810307 RepID=UPI001A979AE4|nr:transglutaminase domain-containing protein [Aridibaculum aurantiacum]